MIDEITGVIELTDTIGCNKISITVNYCIEVTSYEDARPVGSEPMSSEVVTTFEILDCYILSENDPEPYQLTESEINHFKNKLINEVL
jgi:hypothetical protein